MPPWLLFGTFSNFLTIFRFRYVCWSAHLIKRHPKLASKLGKLDSSSNEDGPDGLGCAPALPDYTAKLCMDQKLYFQYFVQDDVEDGTLMDTKIPIDEVGVVSVIKAVGKSENLGGRGGGSNVVLGIICSPPSLE